MPVDIPTPKPAYHHGDLRQSLIDAALIKVDQDGADTISLAALARALGVSQAAPYRHFPDRDALLAAVAAEGFKVFNDALREASGAKLSRSELSRMCRAYVAFGLARPGLYRLMFDSPVLTSGAGGEALQSAAQKGFGQLVEALPRTTRQGGRERQAVRIWAGLHGAVLLAARGLLNGPTTTASLDDLVDDLIA